MFVQDEYEKIKRERSGISCMKEEKYLIGRIKQQTVLANVDNISRTHAYQEYYLRNKEIGWSFLASMVSRNAGWNMTDLEGKYYPRVLSEEIRKQLFLTYESANWLIFSDAYPQLLLYEYSKEMKRPLFHLLQFFYVSIFMEKEWRNFWKSGDRKRLITALIINEQNKIQKPVIEHPFFQKHVFQTLLFKFQELFHFSAVIFPTTAGELYGFSVYQFETLQKRIELGKKLGWLLFHPTYEKMFHAFALLTVHTGSRMDYEQYFAVSKEKDTPQLREAFTIISHHNKVEKDWFDENMEVEAWFLFQEPEEEIDITAWFLQKQQQVHIFSSLNSFF
ncbi:DUF2515 domain-containing protein [Bacillus sp. DX1.1]|uniref:DUF2515 domain-containing protein n=1 Tax=unclassified Bacillus (in: firmicutes) TaxID=185979 RepID=UPI0025704F08|nr:MULTISPECIES: DUF2515 domain-containing protein [unclassified Bacillus (in: firmicutes)]MDM5154174.1 DUF2515 domain-containing protein [Bacillus sp. DX1.1]WJE83095.1 DUF2515 domain-containing protein [Bacillus sp. DX3.1]